MARLVDICNPKQWKTISSDKLIKSGYPVYGANGVIGYYNEYNHKEGTLLITCRGATCGCLNICEPYSYVNGNAMALDNLSRDIDIKYLYYFLLNRGLNDVITGSAQPQIIRQSLEKIIVNYPSMDVQKRIVSNLNEITSIIEKRKKQLVKLDELIKSRFIEMFGNKGENPYNYQTTTMGNVYGFQYGKGNNIPEDKGEYLCYGSNGVVGHHIDYNSEDSPIIGHIGAYAGIVNWGKGKHYVTYNGVICKLNNNNVHPIYGLYLLKLQDYNSVAKIGAAQPFVSYKDLEAPTVNLPPIGLQNKFAKFVERIELQKETIRQSLEKLETLKKSLMQKYFG